MKKNTIMILCAVFALIAALAVYFFTRPKTKLLIETVKTISQIQNTPAPADLISGLTADAAQNLADTAGEIEYSLAELDAFLDDNPNDEAALHEREKLLKDLETVSQSAGMLENLNASPEGLANAAAELTAFAQDKFEETKAGLETELTRLNGQLAKDPENEELLKEKELLTGQLEQLELSKSLINQLGVQ